MSTLICYTAFARWNEILRTNKLGALSLQIHNNAGVVIDWGDGSSETIPNGVVTASHTYALEGEKSITFKEGRKGIYYFGGSNQGVTSLTLRSLSSLNGTLDFSNNANLKRLELPETENTFGVLKFSGCALSGVIDLRQLPNLQGTVQFTGNTGITGFLFSTPRAGIGFLTYLDLAQTGITGTLDLSMLHNLASEIRLNGCASLQGLLLPASTAQFTNINLSGCSSLAGVVDLRSMPNIRNEFRMNGCTSVTGVHFSRPEAGLGAFSRFYLNTTGITGELDLSMLHNLGGELLLNTNRGITSLKMPTTGNAFSVMSMYNMGLIGTLDLSGLSGQANDFYLYGMPGLTNLIFNPAFRVRSRFNVNGCGLNIVFPLGSVILGTTDQQLQNNRMSQANVDATITNAWNGRNNYPANSAKNLHIHGNNAAPSGTYQAPAGYVQGGSDGMPASPREMVYVLVNQTNSDGTLKYRWNITMN